MKIIETEYTRALTKLFRRIVDDFGGDTVAFYKWVRSKKKTPPP